MIDGMRSPTHSVINTRLFVCCRCINLKLIQQLLKFKTGVPYGPFRAFLKSRFGTQAQNRNIAGQMIASRPADPLQAGCQPEAVIDPPRIKQLNLLFCATGRKSEIG